MTTPIRYYSSTALPTNLTGSITNADTTIQVASTSGFPASTPFTLAIDYGAANEELVDVTAVATLSLTVTRAVDFTPASSHNAGAVVRHVSSARDFRDAKAHEIATTDVHGFTPADGEFVGTTKTQTLSNKTLDKATGTLRRVDIYNTGNWTTNIVGDSANPGFNRLAIKDNEISLTSQAEFRSNGSLYLYNTPTELDNVFRLRVSTVSLSADRYSILSGGTTITAPSGTTTFPFSDYRVTTNSGIRRAIRITDVAATASAERFTVWDDGHTQITGQANNNVLLDIKGSAGQAQPYMRVITSASSVLFSVGSDGRVNSNWAQDIRTNNSGAVVPLRVFANTTSQTVALQQWINQSSAVVASVSQTGAASFPSVSASGAVTGATVTATGKIAGQNIRAGSAQTPAPGAANATTTVSVTFSAPMSATPRVVVTPSSASTDVDNSNIKWVVDNETTTGFTIRASRNTLNATNFNYIAFVE